LRREERQRRKDVAIDQRGILNGLAVKDGETAWVTATSRSDVIGGWRARRAEGGIVIDVASGAIVTEKLSMPHSPRWYDNRLWVLNSGTGHLGTVDLASGDFTPRAFCPGFLRGLAFHNNHAVVGLSLSRDGSFSGLALDDEMKKRDADGWCGVQIVNLASGDIVQWMLAQISMIGGDYQLRKTKLFNETGYDKEAPGSVTFQGTRAEIYRNFLGVGNGLPVSDFFYSPRRFGMASPKTDVKGIAGIIHIEPKPVSSCEIRMQGTPDTAIRAPAQLYYYNPGTKVADGSFRVSTGQMELLHGPEEINGFDYDIDPTSLLDVKSILDFIVFNYWQSISAKITVEIIHESGMRLFLIQVASA